MPRRGRLWVIADPRPGPVRARLRDRQHLDPEGGSGGGPRRRDRRSAGDLRRRAAGRRPARLLRRAGDDPGLQRPAVLELPRRLPLHDPGADRKLRPPRRGEDALPPLLGQRKPAVELGFYGAEAAADQGYGWQYTYLFFRNQDEAKRFGIDQDFLDSIAGGIEELNLPEWEEDLEDDGGPDGPIAKRLEGYEELGREPRHPYPPGGDRHRPPRDPDAPGRPELGRDRTGDRRSAVGPALRPRARAPRPPRRSRAA